MSKRIKVELAETQSELAKGLMHRETLAADAGMLFKFQSPVPATFWGKNTYIPLDIAFIDDEHRIIDIKHIAPMSTKMIHSSGNCAFALETNAGFFKDNGIHVGKTIRIVKGPDGKESEIEF